MVNTPAVTDTIARRLPLALPRVLKANIRNKAHALYKQKESSQEMTLLLVVSMISIHQWHDLIEPREYPPTGVSLEPFDCTAGVECREEKEATEPQ